MQSNRVIFFVLCLPLVTISCRQGNGHLSKTSTKPIIVKQPKSTTPSPPSNLNTEKQLSLATTDTVGANRDTNCSGAHKLRTFYVCGLIEIIDEQAKISVFDGTCIPNRQIDSKNDEALVTASAPVVEQSLRSQDFVNGIKIPYVTEGYVAKYCHPFGIPSEHCYEFFYWANQHNYVKIGQLCNLTPEDSPDMERKVAVQVGEPQSRSQGWRWHSSINANTALDSKELCQFGRNEETEKCNEKPL